jgi:hypothetical protein
VGLDGVRAEIAFLQTRDGHGRLELTKFQMPSGQGGNRGARNEDGYRPLLCPRLRGDHRRASRAYRLTAPVRPPSNRPTDKASSMLLQRAAPVRRPGAHNGPRRGAGRPVMHCGWCLASPISAWRYAKPLVRLISSEVPFRASCWSVGAVDIQSPSPGERFIVAAQVFAIDPHAVTWLTSTDC